MGATISTRCMWTAGYSAGGGDGADKIDVGPRNERLMYELLSNVSKIVEENKDEAAVEFMRPLQWQSSLKPSTFRQSRYAGEFDISESQDGERGSVASKEKGSSDEKPLLQLEQMGDRLFVIKVSNFKYLQRVFDIAGSSKLKEIQSAIESNKDPISNIAGYPNAGPGGALMEAFAELQRMDDKGNKKALFSLVLLLNAMDSKLMANSVQTLKKEVRLNMESVREELELLQAFCGPADTCPLQSIDYESDYVFANGCRAPPWRQVYGEICYLEVQPMDGEKMIVTASNSGYFCNKGYKMGSDKETMDYARDGDVHSSLVALLRSRSAHFAKHIENQEYSYEKEMEEEASSTLPNENADASDILMGSGIHDASDDDLEGEMDGKHGRDRQAQGGNQRRSKKKRGVGAKHNYRPSMKWRYLTGREGDTQASGSSRRGQFGSGRANRQVAVSASSVGSAEGKEVFSDSDSEESEEEDVQEKTRNEQNAELPPEYWQIQKLVKYLKGGNQTATIIALCSLRDFDLQNDTNQLAIRDVGGLDVLINLLDTDDPKCKMGSLQVLREISCNYQIKKAICALDGMQPLIELVKDGSTELRCLAAETVANCAKYGRNRRYIRHYGGIRKLVRLLKAKRDDDNVARCGAMALWSCSKSLKNKEAIRNSGAVPLLAKLLESNNESLLIPVVGILQECASDAEYRILIRTSGMIKPLVANLSSDNHELQAHCASAIFKCAEDPETRELVRDYGGLDPLVKLLQERAYKELLSAATGAVWKCAVSPQNVARFQELGAIGQLVMLLEDQPEDVLINVVGALGECAKTAENRVAIRQAGGIPPLVNLLTGTNQALLVNVTRAIGACANDAENMGIIDRLDGVRLLWSLLKSPNPLVQASAAWGICPCIDNAKDAGEMVRSFVGGLELIVSLLKSSGNVEVLASVCAAIANIAKDEENLAVITDHGVVPMLAKLARTNNEKLRRHLAEAIARCCHWGNNKVAFGSAGAVAPLVKYLKSNDETVHRSTARALYQLSLDPDNCITMHESGVVSLLLGMVGSADEGLQEASAGCIGNIRRLALASEKAMDRSV